MEEHIQNNSVQLAAFDMVCAQMLQDIQERLVYRTHVFIRQEILNYKPGSGDLAYPDKLEMMQVCPGYSLFHTPWLHFISDLILLWRCYFALEITLSCLWSFCVN